MTFYKEKNRIKFMEKIINTQEKYDTQKHGEVLFKLLVNTEKFTHIYKDLHWNIIGKNFYSLHLLFEKHADQISEGVDEIAERIRQMDVVVKPVMENLDLAFVNYFKGDYNDHAKVLDHLISQHNSMIEFLEKNIDIINANEDASSTDLATKILQNHQQQRWFLASERAEIKNCQCENCDCK